MKALVNTNIKNRNQKLALAKALTTDFVNSYKQKMKSSKNKKLATVAAMQNVAWKYGKMSLRFSNSSDVQLKRKHHFVNFPIGLCQQFLFFERLAHKLFSDLEEVPLRSDLRAKCFAAICITIIKFSQRGN